MEWLEYRRVVTENCTESLEYLRGGTVILDKERLEYLRGGARTLDVERLEYLRGVM